MSETPEFLRVKDHTDLIRDSKNNAILTTDNSGLNKYKEERDFKLKLSKIAKEHETMKHDVVEIKELLKTLIGKL
jgi:hypothetical protein